jgi:hypothetical protein
VYGEGWTARVLVTADERRQLRITTDQGGDASR